MRIISLLEDATLRSTFQDGRRGGTLKCIMGIHVIAWFSGMRLVWEQSCARCGKYVIVFHQGAVMIHTTNGPKNNFVRLQCILKAIHLEKGEHRPPLIYTFPFNFFTLGLFRFHMYRISLELSRFFSKVFEQKAKMRMGR